VYTIICDFHTTMLAIAHTLTQSCQGTMLSWSIQKANIDFWYSILILDSWEQERLAKVEFTFASSQVLEADQC